MKSLNVGLPICLLLLIGCAKQGDSQPPGGQPIVASQVDKGLLTQANSEVIRDLMNARTDALAELPTVNVIAPKPSRVSEREFAMGLFIKLVAACQRIASSTEYSDSMKLLSGQGDVSAPRLGPLEKMKMRLVADQEPIFDDLTDRIRAYVYRRKNCDAFYARFKEAFDPRFDADAEKIYRFRYEYDNQRGLLETDLEVLKVLLARTKI